MSETSKEIDNAVARLAIGDSDFRRLGPADAAAFVSAMESAFVTAPGRRWLWEAFKHPWCAAKFADQDAFAQVARVVPNVDEGCRFVVEDDDDQLLVHACSPRVAVNVIRECFAFEYYLADPNLRWLVCENHHDTLFAVGDEVIPRLETVAADVEVAVFLSEASDA